MPCGTPRVAADTSSDAAVCRLPVVGAIGRDLLVVFGLIAQERELLPRLVECEALVVALALVQRRTVPSLICLAKAPSSSAFCDETPYAIHDPSRFQAKSVTSGITTSCPFDRFRRIRSLPVILALAARGRRFPDSVSAAA